MQWTSAPNIAGAPLPQRARRFWETRFGGLRESVEAFLERERGQLPPWFVVGFGTGIVAWFALGQPRDWAAFLCVSAALAVAGFSMRGGRAERAIGWFGLAMMLGCALVWGRSAWVAAPRLERPLVTQFRAKVERVETRVAKQDLRLTLAPADPALPPRVRVRRRRFHHRPAFDGLGPPHLSAARRGLVRATNPRGGGLDRHRPRGRTD